MWSFAPATTGCDPPSLRQPFTKVELGCGCGVPLPLEAAAYPHAQFYGIDINPTHISWAKRFAAEAQLDNVHYLEIGFADLFESGIPELEFIGVHGVWSWVSQSNRDLDLRRLRAHRLNGQLMGGSMKGQDVGFLLSPVSGGGHRVIDVYQFFDMAAVHQGDPVAFAWEILQQLGRRLKSGQNFIETPAESIAELEKRFQSFEASVKPQLQKLSILP